MTSIAWDGVTLAADKKRTLSGVPMSYTKIFTAQRDGATLLFGCAGHSGECEAFRRWARGGAQPRAFRYFTALCIDEVRRAWITDEDMVWTRVTLPWWAIGSGAPYALGAMAAGKTARQAIEIASRLDNSSGLGIDTLRLP